MIYCMDKKSNNYDEMGTFVFFRWTNLGLKGENEDFSF